MNISLNVAIHKARDIIGHIQGKTEKNTTNMREGHISGTIYDT
jgi:translation initiation factor IF-1